MEERVKVLQKKFSDRNGGKEVSVTHMPTDQEPFLSMTCNGSNSVHNFKVLSPVEQQEPESTESVNSAQVRELHMKYQYGILDCRRALRQAGGDVSKAHNILRGLTK